MEVIFVWFILTGGSGYTPPIEVRNPPCGIPGFVVGVLVDRLVNPTAVMWPDPKVKDQHCRIDITQYMTGLTPGQYHIATTEITKTWNAGSGVSPEAYIGIDPHTSVYWVRQTGPSILPGKPINFRIQVQPQ